VAFRDVRAQPLTSAEIDAIITEFGDRAVNKQSTTYRGFSDFLRESEADAQIAAQPTVMKRPIIQEGATWYLGWDEAIEAKVTA
jgi:arsenate reductase-like glutaredoxin family protein